MTAEITLPMPPARVAALVASVIRADLARLDMESWTSARGAIPVGALLKPGCRSTCCAAGWTAVLTAPEGSALVPDPEMTRDLPGDWDLLEMIRLPDGRLERIAEYAAAALGLGAPDRTGAGRPMWDLFDSWQTPDRVLAALDRIAAGAP